MRSRQLPATRSCPRSNYTPRRRIKSGWRGRQWRILGVQKVGILRLTDEPLAEFTSLRRFNGIRGSGGTGVRLRLEQLEQATGGESGNAEHQVAEYLDGAADPQMTPAVVVFEGAIDALGGGALVVDQIIRIGHVDGAAGSAFGGDFGLQHGVTAGVAVDDRYASHSLAIGDDGGGIVGGVHDVVEPDDALLALAGERDGDLAVVNRGGGE